MPSIFIINDGDKTMAKKKKTRRVRRGLGAAKKGACKLIRRRDGRSQQLCHTGKGATGWTLMPLGTLGARKRRRRAR